MEEKQTYNIWDYYNKAESDENKFSRKNVGNL